MTTSRILPVIVVSQFCCTSLWFASNGVMPELINEFHLPGSALEHLTSAVQLGFIGGTLIFALFTIADRFSPSKVFMASAVLGALFNAATIWEQNSFISLVVFRVLTGFFLAGIYPVGMKIASDYFKEGLGKSLGLLVGALVIGTSFPHFTKDILSDNYQWRLVVLITSAIAIVGGVMMRVLVPDGPYRKQGHYLDFTAFIKVFKKRDFRSAAFGYFGHMWELYAFWAFIPLILTTYTGLHPEVDFNIPFVAFLIIALGGLACMAAGYLSALVGARKVAIWALGLSGLCCLLSPLVFIYSNVTVFLMFLVFWGLMVIPDSPMFSTLVAKSAPAETRGTALTIVNSLGFAITIVSLQTIGMILTWVDPIFVFTVLSVGPVVGLWFFSTKHQPALIID